MLLFGSRYAEALKTQQGLRALASHSGDKGRLSGKRLISDESISTTSCRLSTSLSLIIKIIPTRFRVSKTLIGPCIYTTDYGLQTWRGTNRELNPSLILFFTVASVMSVKVIAP